MSSISSLTSLNVRLSPLDLLRNELSSEVSAGTIASADQAALSAALEDIDASLTSQAASDRASGTAPPSPTEMQAKIDALIAAEVANGNLTSEQADDLKNVFSSAFANGPGGAGGPGGPGGAGGPPPGGPPGEGGASDSDSTSTTSTDIETLLKEFLKLLQDANSTASTYNASGQSTSVTAALLLDYQG